MNKPYEILLFGLLALQLIGCASYPHNPRLLHYDQNTGYRYDNLDKHSNSESLFVVLSFSGGGTRAAALSYGVMEKLRTTKIQWEGRERRLLDEVDVISSVSGGSFTSAYYGLFGEALFLDFPKVFLHRDIEGELKRLVVKPVNWLRLASPSFGRIDLVAEFYDREIFDERSYADLTRQGSPFIMLNATDMSMGSQFIFTQDQFDLICSDLSGVKVARAVAASSNFPVAFTPLTINNYAGSCGFTGPVWLDLALQDLQINPSRFNRARIAKSYLDGLERPYVHLLDGGVSDNIGLRGPLIAMSSNDPEWNVVNKINRGEIRKIVVITVDAKTSPPLQFDRSPNPPGTIDVLRTLTDIPMGNYSFDTVEWMREIFKEWGKAGKVYASCERILQGKCPAAEMPFPAPAFPDLYRVYVGFDQIKDEQERKYFQAMPTSFTLPEQDVDNLIEVAKTLMDDSAGFQALLSDLP